MFDYIFKHFSNLITLLALVSINSKKYQKSPKSLRNYNTISASYFYIYDWPKDIIDRWPDSYSHHRLAILDKFRDNYGLGTLIDAEVGLYHTHQYSLFETFYHRLLESRYRTNDPEKASIFFIPYDIGMDASIRKTDGALFQTNCPKLKDVTNLLTNSIFFKRNNGNDHFSLHSINQPMHYYINIKCMEFYQFCHNCTKFSIDTYSPKIYRSLKDFPEMIHKWISIPFPANL